MSLSGQFSTMGLSTLLVWLSDENKTGTLTVNDGRVEKNIYVRDGTIVSSSSSDPREYLGHFLISHGFLSEEDLELALTRQERASNLLGRILVDLNLILEPDLEKMLQLKAEESIFDVFTWEDGDFMFAEEALPQHEMVPISVGVGGLIEEGKRRANEWAFIRERIPSRDCVPVPVSDPLQDAEDVDESRRQILAAVDGERTIEEIGFETHATDYFICVTLFPAVERGAIEIVEPTAPAAAPSRPAGALLTSAVEKLSADDIAGALTDVRAARRLAPADADVVDAAERTETRIRNRLESDGLHPGACPHLVGTLDDLKEADISSKQAFLLSRVNGVYDVGGITKISPMAPIDTLHILWGLLRAGHIRMHTPDQNASPPPV